MKVFVSSHIVKSITVALASSALVSGIAQAQTEYRATIGSAAQEVKGWGFTPGLPMFNQIPQGQPNAGAYSAPLGAIYNTVYDLKPSFIRGQIAPETLKDYFPDAPIIENRIQLDETELITLTTVIGSAKQKGIGKFILSTWSPPAEFKTNNSPRGYVDANGNGQRDSDEPRGTLRTDREQAFCDYYAKVLNRLKSRTYQGATIGLPATISIQNEPGLAPDYDGCYYDGVEGWDQWRRVVKKMRTTFDANGLTSVKIYGPEAENYDSALDYLGTNRFSMLQNDSNLDSAIGAFGWHSYGGDKSDVSEVKMGRNAFPGKESWMTEYCPLISPPFEGTSWTIRSARRVASDFVDMKVDYWAFWRAHNNEGGVNRREDGESRTLTIGGDATTAPTKTKQYHFFKKLWNTVLPASGWNVRPFSFQSSGLPLVINNTVSDKAEGVDMVAFSDSGKMVIMIVNPTVNDVKIRIDGINRNSNGQLRRFITNATQDMQENTFPVTVTNGWTDWAVSFPKESVTLMVTEGRGATASPQRAPSDGSGAL